VLKWPDQKKVLQALKHWVENLVKTRCDIVQIGYFGSYARGDWGVGSDLDLVIIVDQTDKPFELRSAEFDTLELPIPTDVLVYTLEEWYLLRSRRAFFQTLSQKITWVYHYKNDFDVTKAKNIK
jgi:predicted nucleotidyltransferase